MNLIFLGVVIWNVIFFIATMYAGIYGLKNWHFALGVITGIFTCGTHSLVFIQLIGSGKGIKEAVDAYGLAQDEGNYIERAKQFKSKAFPYAMFVPMLTIAVTWLGAWHDTNRFADPQSLALSHELHSWTAWIALFINFFAFWKEYQAISENTYMIRELNEKIRAKDPNAALLKGGHY